MTRVVTIAGTAITSTSDLDSIKVGGQAKQGDSALSEVIVYDDSNALFGTAEKFIRKQWSVTENASGTAVYLARGRIAAFETHRGEDDSVQGAKVQYTWALEDANLELRGHDINDWVRPEETGYARVTALGTAYLNGSPRATTNLDTTTYVPNSNTVTMPAKTYNNADAFEIITECAAAEEKKFFVTVDHELWYDLESSTSYLASLEISDGVGAAADPDGTNYFAPIWDLGSALSWEGQNYASRLRLGYNQDFSVLATDAASEADHDLWVAHVADTETTDAAMATAFANAELSYRKGGERTYALSLKIPAAQAYKIKHGQVIWIHSQAAVDTTARVQRRIAELMWEPDGPYWYIARINLDRPVRRRIRGSVSGPTPTGPHSAPVCLPDTAGVALITWNFEQGNSFDTTATYDSDLNYVASGSGTLNGSAYGYTDASSRTTDSFAVTASTDYTLSLEYKFKFDTYTAYVKVHWQNASLSHIGEVLILSQTGHATNTTYETTANVTAPVGAAFAYLDFSGRSSMSVDNVIWGEAGTGVVNDPYCLIDPGDSPYYMKSDDPRVQTLIDQMETVGFSWKTPVRAATTAAGTLASSFEEGDTVDGVVLAEGDRILLQDQATGAENGIYTVNATGAPTRAVDFDSGGAAVGAAAFVSEGTANANKVYVCTTNAPIEIDTTTLVFAEVTAAPAFTVEQDGGDSVADVDGIIFDGAATVVEDSPGVARVTVGVNPASTVTLRSHGVHVYDSAVQAIPHNVTTAFNGFDTVRGSDPDGYFSAGAPDRLTIPAGLGGRYLLKGHTFNDTLNPDHDIILCFDVSSTGHPDQSMCYTATTESSRATQPAGYIDISHQVVLDAGDYVRLQCYIDNAPTEGGPFDFGHATSEGARTALMLVYLGPTALSGVELDYLDLLDQASDPAAPAAGMDRIFAKAGAVYLEDEASTVTLIGPGTGPILISDAPSTPLIFADLIQNEAQDDLVYADV